MYYNIIITPIPPQFKSIIARQPSDVRQQDDGAGGKSFTICVSARQNAKIFATQPPDYCIITTSHRHPIGISIIFMKLLKTLLQNLPIYYIMLTVR